MAALQVYSNSYVWYEYVIYVSLFTVSSIIVIQIYLYIVDYIQYLNDKIDKMNRILSQQTEVIEKYNRKFIRFEEESIQCRISIQDHSQWISGISKEINGCENRIEKTEERVNNMVQDNKINIDRMEERMVSLDSKINNTGNDIYNIERSIHEIQKNVQLIPEYVLIGYRFEPSYQIPIPVFVPNDIKIDSEMFKMYKMSDCVLFVNHFKYLKNVNYLNFNELENSFSRIRFSKCIDPNYDSNNTHILTITDKNISSFYLNTHNIISDTNYYIPSIQGNNNRNYFKKGLLLLRSELLKNNIKLVLNSDFEEFIR